MHPDGSMAAQRDQGRSGRSSVPVTLPAAYVAQHVQLAYASTIHGAQGATVDTTHTVLTGTENRQSLYVALSRGRESNHLYLGPPTAPMDSVGLDVQGPPVGPREVLTEILERDGRLSSATTIARGDVARQLREAVLRYQDALPVLAQQVIGKEPMVALDDAFERWLPGITGQPAYPHLRGQVALRWVDGEVPKVVIDDAMWFTGKVSLAECDDPAAVLAWRTRDGGLFGYGDGPLPWLPQVPDALRLDPEINQYLGGLADRIGDLKERVVSEARPPSAAEDTPWRRALPPDVDRELAGDLAVWRATHGVPETDARPTGPPIDGHAKAQEQARLTSRLTAPANAPTAPRRTAPSPTLGTSSWEQLYGRGPSASVDSSPRR